MSLSKRLGAAIAFAMALAAPGGAVVAGVCEEDCRPEVEPLSKSCYSISATMDGGLGNHAIERSRQALRETIEEFRRTRPPEEGWMGRLKINPMRVKPNPYLRDVITRDLMLGESRSGNAFTVCWRGVLAPAVCTSGAKVCR